MSDIKLSLLANSINFIAKAQGLVNNAGEAQTLNFASQDGAIKIQVSPKLFPFMNVDDVGVVLMSLVKADLSQVDDGKSPLLLPDNKLVV